MLVKLDRCLGGHPARQQLWKINITVTYLTAIKTNTKESKKLKNGKRIQMGFYMFNHPRSIQRFNEK